MNSVLRSSTTYHRSHWREWMGRIEAVLFCSASPVIREDLAWVVGQGLSVEMLIEDTKTERISRPDKLAQVVHGVSGKGGRMLRTRTKFADAIKAATDLGDQSLAFTEVEMGLLCAIAYHQPIDGAGLKDIFNRDVSRELLARLRYKGLIASGPRSPRPCAPHKFVMTETFLAVALTCSGFLSNLHALAVMMSQKTSLIKST